MFINKVKNDLLALGHYNMITNDDTMWSSVAFVYLNLLLNRPSKLLYTYDVHVGCYYPHIEKPISYHTMEDQLFFLMPFFTSRGCLSTLRIDSMQICNLWP